MYEVKLTVSEETMSALNLTPEQVRDEMCLAAAVKLYELGRISSGVAANLAGVSRVIFLSKLADYGVDTFQLTEAELTEDVANA
jgi:predicted HTH domain antitoxin